LFSQQQVFTFCKKLFLLFFLRSDTDSGRSSDYKSDDNSLRRKLEGEPTKYFSLPRPKYIRSHENISTDNIVELPIVKLRENPDNFRQRRVGGRRNTVDVSSSDVENALGVRKSLSRSASTLTRPFYDDFRMKNNVVNAKKPDLILEETEEDEKQKGPEFIINSKEESKVLDISDPKVIFHKFQQQFFDELTKFHFIFFSLVALE
jgi:hypothetical protein